MNAPLVRTRNLVNSRRARESSSGMSMGKSCRQRGCWASGRPSGKSRSISPWLRLMASPSFIAGQQVQAQWPTHGWIVHGGRHIEMFDGTLAGHHHVYLGTDRLLAKLELIDGPRTGPQPLDLLARGVEQGATGTDGGTHRLEAGGGPIVAHVALHHQIELTHHLGNAERAGEHTIRAGDAARFASGHDSTIARAFDGVRGANIGAGRRFTVHAHHGSGLRGHLAVDEIQMDHRVSLVRLAFGTGMDTGLAADAAVRINEKFHLGSWHRVFPVAEAYCCGSRRLAYSGSCALRSRTAHTLYSGIFEIGSWAA